MSTPGCPPVVGIIGGSGVYDIDGLQRTRNGAASNRPSARRRTSCCSATLDGQQVVFLPRHGRGHRIPPSEINFRANIDALKRAGVTEIISLSAVGSLREDLPPGTFVSSISSSTAPSPATKSFFASGLVAHVSMADPGLRPAGRRACRRRRRRQASTSVRGGTYLVMEGPQFSSRAESELYRSWGCDVIGMTNMPEAKLAREAEMCYATVAMVTDYDCWHPDHDDVTVDAVIKVLLANADKARALVRNVVPLLSGRQVSCTSRCHTALDHALITAPDMRDDALKAKLGAVAGRVL